MDARVERENDSLLRYCIILSFEKNTKSCEDAVMRLIVKYRRSVGKICPHFAWRRAGPIPARIRTLQSNFGAKSRIKRRLGYYAKIGPCRSPVSHTEKEKK